MKSLVSLDLVLCEGERWKLNAAISPEIARIQTFWGLLLTSSAVFSAEPLWCLPPILSAFGHFFRTGRSQPSTVFKYSYFEAVVWLNSASLWGCNLWFRQLSGREGRSSHQLKVLQSHNPKMEALNPVPSQLLFRERQLFPLLVVLYYTAWGWLISSKWWIHSYLIFFRFSVHFASVNCKLCKNLPSENIIHYASSFLL